MKPKQIRTVLAAAAVAIAGTGFAAGAQAAGHGFDKASAETQAEPAAKVVNQGARQIANAPTEKNNQPACGAPATKTAGQPGTQMAVEPRQEKCQ